MPTIRQEINIINRAAGSTGAVLPEIVQLDTTQYGSPTYYFEIINSNSVGSNVTWTLRRKGTTTDDANIVVPSGATTNTRYRSSSFSPPAGQTEYQVFTSDASALTINTAARIIIIDAPSTLTSSETQIEIGANQTFTATTATALTSAKYWTYTAANWDGTKTFDAEVCYKTASTNTATITLQEDNGSFASWVDIITIVNGVSNTSATRTRTTAHFTPTDGRHYRLAVKDSTTKSNITIYNAKVIVNQIGDTTTANYYFDAHSAGPTDTNSAWTNDANAFDNDNTTSASSTSATSTDILKGTGTTAPTSGNNIIQVEVRFRSGINNGAAADSAYTTLSIPSGGWTWTKVNGLEVRYSPDHGIPGPAWAEVFSSGSSLGHATAGSNYNTSTQVYYAEVRVTYYAGTNNPTLLEPQYHLLNLKSTSTGLRGYYTLHDATNEWVGVTNTYKHAQDAIGAGANTRLKDVDNSNAILTNSSITGANQTIGSAITDMPSAAHQLDIDIVNAGTEVDGNRIFVAVSVNASTPSFIAQPPIVINQAINRASSW